MTNGENAFQISAEPIDTQALQAQVTSSRAGALVTFEGWVREQNEGRQVRRLEYEAFAPLAEKEGAKILAEASERFPIERAICVHRVGSLEIGGLAVFVAVSAAHRGAAFDACRYIIDETKARVPIWKKEHFAEGDSGWVNCATSL